MNKKILVIGISIMLIACMSIPVFAAKSYSGATAQAKKYGIFTKTYQEELKITNGSTDHTIEVKMSVNAYDSSNKLLGSDSYNKKIKCWDIFGYKSKTVKSGKFSTFNKGTWSYNIDDSTYYDSGSHKKPN